MDKPMTGTEVERREKAFHKANPPPDILDYFITTPQSQEENFETNPPATHSSSSDAKPE